ncbi:MAG TPA: FtsX-like permease family protein, partial [Gammaproteobacteria bacterium]|nr:FtsX-like permease family protein [Gammaproteobacteria bacterium]
IKQEPDAANSVLLIAPRVIMHSLDLPKTKILQQGSRLSYQLWIAGDRSSVEKYHQWLQAQHNLNWRIDTLKQGRSPIQRLFSYAQDYLGLIVLLVVIMSGLSIQLATRFWIQERVQIISLYKVLGATPVQVVRIFALGLMSWSVLICIIFIFLGVLLCYVFLLYLQTHYTIISVKISIYPILLSFFICIGLMLGFSLPPLWSAKHLLPSLVFRETLVKHKTTWVFYSLSLAFCLSLLYFYVQQVTLTLYVIAGIGWAAFIAFMVLWAILIGLSKIPTKPFVIRVSLRYLHKNLTNSAFQVVAFTLVLITMIVLYGIRGDFLQQWKAQLPHDTPNYFLINIAPENVPPLTTLIQDHLQQSAQFYPIVRGRLTHINSRPVTSELEDNSQESIQRPLNLTFGDAIPSDNQVVQGGAWNASLQNKPLISLERSLSHRLKVTLGDTLSFFIDGQTITGTIYQIRNVQWQSFRPNFFVIFPQGVIDNFPSMYITSFYIPDNKKDVLLTIHNTFPEITTIDIEKIIKEIQYMMNIMIHGIESLIWIIFVFAFIIMATILMTTKPQRKKNVALMKLLGTTRKNIILIIAFEYFLMGFIAGLVAISASIWIEYQLAHAIFDVNYHIPWFRLVIFWIGSMIVLGLFGSISLKDVINQSPLLLLKS